MVFPPLSERRQGKLRREQELGPYCIKAGYTSNSVPATHEEHSDTFYWDSSRLRVSKLYQYAVYMLACRLVRAHEFSSVIDVGCGVGTKLEALHRKVPEVEITGIDQYHAIAFCRETWDFGSWYVDDFDDPDPRLASLKGDLVICADVIEHLVNPDVLLSYLKQRVAKGGLIVLSTPERDLLRGAACYVSPNPYHVREWNAQELKAYLESSGFEVLTQTLQLPVKPSLHRTLWTEVGKRLLAGKPVRYNQVFTIRVA